MNPVFEFKKVLIMFIKYFESISKRTFIIVISFFCLSFNISAQKNNTPDSVQYLSLDQCIVYALQNQPAIIQTSIDISIAQKTNAINLSAWLPQVNVNGNLMHYNQLPTAFSVNSANPNGPLLQGHTGMINTFLPQLSATQTIFSPDVLNAAKSAHLYVQQAKQSNDSTKITLIANVSKGFYNLLLTLEQMNVLKEDTARLAKNLRDTYHQYIGGTADKTDYKEAAISLNNSKAQLKQVNESIRPQYATLKQFMGFPPEKDFSVSFDTLQMIKEIAFDTTQQLQYEKRIEFQQLETTKSLQLQALSYYRSQSLPTLSAFYNYVYEYESNTTQNFFNQAYPYSYVGASISIPLFTGLRQRESIQRAKLQGEKIAWAEIGLKSNIYSEYTTALANYKSNLYSLGLMRENVAMAKDVYSVVSLQYNQGVIAYLNVITAESNLISSEISYLNALFQVLLSKVDLEKAMGNTLSKY